MTELTILKDVNKIPHPNVVRFVGGCSIAGSNRNWTDVKGMLTVEKQQYELSSNCKW